MKMRKQKRNKPALTLDTILTRAMPQYDALEYRAERAYTANPKPKQKQRSNKSKTEIQKLREIGRKAAKAELLEARIWEAEQKWYDKKH